MVLVSGGIDDLCLKYFVEAGAMGVRRCKKADLKRIARATGGKLTQFKVNRLQIIVAAKNITVLQLFISRMPKMCAIPQLVLAPLNPIPTVEHFRRSHPQCEHSYRQS